MWKTLSFTGLNLEPKYIAHKIPLKVNKKYQILSEELEEKLTAFTKCKGYEIIKNDNVFKNNFIKSCKCLNFKLEDADFKSWHENLKLNSTQYQKKHIVYVDGKQLKDANTYVEHSCVFKGRGNHPLRGTYKPRILSTDIILNMSENRLKDKNQWKDIRNNPQCNWIASWEDKVTRKTKYLFLNSGYENSIKKYDKSRELKKKLTNIRTITDKNIQSKYPKIRQLALATYLIDKLGIRIGNEEENTTTIGCCLLTKKNISIKGDQVSINFIGKDSIPFMRTFKPSGNYLNELKQFESFDKISPNSLNRYLCSIMDDLTAKVFRTCNANCILLRYLKSSENPIDRLQKGLLAVAKYCNHCIKNGDKYKYSINTCKKNYIDPRIIFSYCNKMNIDVNKIFSKELIKHHEWAINSSKDFKY